MAKPEALASALGELEPALVLIDTLARAMGGADENSGANMGAFVSNVDTLRGLTGAHVLAVHATRHGRGRDFLLTGQGRVLRSVVERRSGYRRLDPASPSSR